MSTLYCIFAYNDYSRNTMENKLNHAHPLDSAQHSSTATAFNSIEYEYHRPWGPKRGSRSIALTFREPGHEEGIGWLAPRPGRFTPLERDPVPVVQEAGWAPGPVWTAAENLALTGIRSPDRPARSESLYRLRYPDPGFTTTAYVRGRLRPLTTMLMTLEGLQNAGNFLISWTTTSFSRKILLFWTDEVQ
jgi:hypothetical protein